METNQNGRVGFREYLVIAMAIVIFILLFIWAWSLRSDLNNKDKELSNLIVEKAKLQKDLDDCNENSEYLLLQIDSLKNLIPEKKIVQPTRVKARVQEPLEATVYLNVKVREDNVTTVARAPEVVKKDLIVTQPQTRSASSSSVTTSIPSYYYDELGEIKFCVRLGGSENRHLPHLAIYDGIIAQENNLSGYNWVVLPSRNMTGDWGVTEDGTFYVISSLIDKYLTNSDRGIVELKGPATNWKAEQMSKSGGYYIYKK